MNQYHPDVIARREEESRKLAEAAEEKKKQQMEQLRDVMAKNRIVYFNCGKPRNPEFPEVRESNPLQKQLLDAWKEEKYKVFTYLGANRIGKTTVGSVICISTAAGEWPWSGEKLKFTHNLPRKIRWIGQGWESSIKMVIEPSLKFWWPEAYIKKTKKNNQGIESVVELWSRSHDKGILGTIEIMSTSQAVEVFEGWHGDLVIYDEPPPRDIRIACARGLVDRQGRELFCCTLLNQAWIHREVIKATLNDGTPDPTVYNISGDISVNVGYGITQQGVDQFAKTLTHDEKQARIMGKPSYLSTLVCPRFDRKHHIKERFTIPLDALISISCDFHPSKPWVATFMAHTKQGFKYLCDELEFRGNAKSFAEEIVRIIRQRDYARVERVIIDPLSKSGTPNDMDTYSVVEETLAAYGYSLETASKDKDNGISILNDLLWTDNEMPALYFFRDCWQTIQQVEDWMFDKDTFKPSKEKDDFVETLYRHCLLGLDWYAAWENKSSGSCKSVIL